MYANLDFLAFALPTTKVPSNSRDLVNFWRPEKQETLANFFCQHKNVISDADCILSSFPVNLVFDWTLDWPPEASCLKSARNRGWSLLESNTARLLEYYSVFSLRGFWTLYKEPRGPKCLAHGVDVFIRWSQSRTQRFEGLKSCFEGCFR